MNGNLASGALLVVVGLWLLFQTLGGDLPERIVSWSKAQQAAAPTGPKHSDKGQR